MAKVQHRNFHAVVWIGRAIGWALLLVAIVGAAEAEFLPSMIGGFEYFTCLATGLAAVIWIVGFELFLRFFDRYLSGN
jgi:hypothetical protein